MPSKKPEESLQTSLYNKMKIIRYDWYIFILLMCLSILGIGLTDAVGKLSRWYWVAMVPVFYGCNLFLKWQTSKAKGIKFAAVLLTQAQYWLGLLGAIYLTFRLENIGSINNDTTGMILLLILALSIFQTGVTSGWLFQLLGVFLGLCLLIVAYIDNYVWAILGLTIIVLLAYFFISSKYGHMKEK